MLASPELNKRDAATGAECQTEPSRTPPPSDADKADIEADTDADAVDPPPLDLSPLVRIRFRVSETVPLLVNEKRTIKVNLLGLFLFSLIEFVLMP